VDHGWFDEIQKKFTSHGWHRKKQRIGEEEDGQDEILVPGDFKESGHILDDWLFAEFVKKIRAGVHVVVIVDCCHSGTALDLPYVCNAGEGEIRRSEGFKIPASGVDLKPKKGEKKKKKEKSADKTEKSEKSDKKKKKSSKKSAEDADVEPQPEEEPPIDKKSKKSKKKKSKSDERVALDSEEEPEPEPEPEPAKKKGLFRKK
jgi:Caspase domain